MASDRFLRQARYFLRNGFWIPFYSLLGFFFLFFLFGHLLYNFFKQRPHAISLGKATLSFLAQALCNITVNTIYIF